MVESPINSTKSKNLIMKLFFSIPTKVLLFCGFLSSLFYISTDLIASWWYKGYNILDQNYSELLATGAPTRPFMILMSFIYTFLIVAFAVGIWISANPKRFAHFTGMAIITYAVIGLSGGLIFQMDLRGAEKTLLGSLHPLMTSIMSIFIMLSIALGAFLHNKKFRYYSFITIVVLLIFGGLTALQAPQLEAGGLTPWMGLTERINIYTTMLWFALLSFILILREKK
ncbi:MAG: DUF998 domain-containing protein [Candidatus Hodarchaeota archaeon]